MRAYLRNILAVAVVLACGSAFAEQIDNPQYTAWAKFKPGTSVTTQMQSDMGGSKTEIETTMTLVEINADKAVVENKSTMNMAGQKMDMPAQKTDVPAKIDKPATPPGGEAPKADVKESSEDVDVAGKKVTCKVVEAKTTANGMNMQSKTWTSDEVPGHLVKSETTSDGAMKGTTSTKVTAMTIK